MYGWCSIWVYRDPHGNIIGFGTLDLSKEYDQFTSGNSHVYIPLLAVNPAFQRRGHGRSIVQHLFAEAVLIAQSCAGFPQPLVWGPLSDFVFLDVYTANQPAVHLYTTCGFVKLNPTAPFLDPHENNEPYIVMAKKIVAGAP
jgi:ribosomal protein S18 acetylase RimI-like enzyme